MKKPTELKCLECHDIIITDIEKWAKNNPTENYIQCPYCGYVWDVSIFKS